MEWKVGNALSRDVERQHLNKILADIRTTINGVSKTASAKSTNTNTVSTVTRYAVARFTITLQGDVTGSAYVDGLNDVVIETTAAGGGVEEAPSDNQYYWRWNGEWKAVPHSLSDKPDGFGFLVQIENGDYELENVVREIEVEPGELTISDGDGVAANPVIGLATTGVTPGTYTNADIEVDEFGRVVTAASGSGSGGILPVVTGEVPPVFVYLDDGSLVYTEVA